MTFLFIQEAFTKHLLRIVHNMGESQKNSKLCSQGLCKVGEITAQRWVRAQPECHWIHHQQSRPGAPREQGEGGGRNEKHTWGASCRRRRWRGWEGARPSRTRRPCFQNKMSCSQVRCGRATGSLGDSWAVRLLGAVVQNSWQLQCHPTEKAQVPARVWEPATVWIWRV